MGCCATDLARGSLVACKVLDVQTGRRRGTQRLPRRAGVANALPGSSAARDGHGARRYARKGMPLRSRLGEALHQGRNVPPALAQRGRLQHFAAEPVEQVSRKRPLSISARRSRCVAATMRKLIAGLPSLARRCTCQSSSTGSDSLDLHRYVGYFIEEQRAPLPAQRRAGGCFPAAGEGAGW